jgi:hypothetical protein
MTCVSSVAVFVYAVKYEARLEDGTVVSKSDGVEFAVKDGRSLSLLILCNCIGGFFSEVLVLFLMHGFS